MRMLGIQSTCFTISALTILFISLLLLTGCASAPPKPAINQPTSSSGHFTKVKQTKHDGAPPRIDVSKIPNAIPKPEKITKAGNKNPYKVWGKTYHLLPSSNGYREKGIASWYGTKFHGRHTSNGEIYDVYAMTAAHKTLPIPAYVKVTNRNNNRSVIVRVNDRGPFHSRRIIDLSYAAAEKLGFAQYGTAPVEVEAINIKDYQQTKSIQPQTVPKKATELPKPESPSRKASNTKTNTYLQVGAYSNADKAHSVQQELIEFITDTPIIINSENSVQSSLYKVWIGPLDNHLKINSLITKLEASSFSSPILITK